MQLSHHCRQMGWRQVWCIYLPICSFHTIKLETLLVASGVFTCQYAAFTPKVMLLSYPDPVYLPANMQLSHPASIKRCPIRRCIYLPICSFHTGFIYHSRVTIGVFTCQYAAFTPCFCGIFDREAVYLPANMQLSHLYPSAAVYDFGCIYLPICSFHTVRGCRAGGLHGVFTCQYAAFTP